MFTIKTSDGSKKKFCKIRGNVGMLKNEVHRLVIVVLEKAEVLIIFLPKSSEAVITSGFPVLPGLVGKEQFMEEKLGMS